MRIKEFVIHRYGPLSETGVIRLNNFTLFWGENEDGKTLTIDALIKILIGKSRKMVTNIDRVPEEPEGFVILQDNTGNDIKIPEAGRLPELLNLSGEECLNLFVIRNSDLTLAKEAEFFGSVTERLTGIRTNRLRSLKGKLRQFGNLTDTLQIENTKDSHFLKNRLLKADALLEDCQKLYADSKSNEFDKLEEKLIHLQKDRDILEQEIANLDEARLRNKFETGRENLQKLIEFNSEMDNLVNFTIDEFISWQQAEKTIEEKKLEIVDVEKKINENQVESGLLQKEIHDTGVNLQILQKKKTRIDTKLNPLLEEHGQISEKYAHNSPKKKVVLALLSVSLVVSIISVFGIIWKPQNIVYMVGGGSLILNTILFVFYYFLFLKSSARLGKLKHKIFFHAGKFGFTGEGIPQIQSQVEETAENIQNQQLNMNNLENKKVFLDKSIAELREQRLKEIEQRIKSEQERIRDIKVRNNLKSIEEYEQKISQKNEMEKRIAESVSILKNNFGKEGDTFQDQIDFWQLKVNELKEFENDGERVAFNEKELEKKKGILKNINDEIQGIQKSLQDFRQRLIFIERRAQEILLWQDEEHPCENLTDLVNIEVMLKEFKDELETRQNQIKTALEILNEIEANEEKKVSSLFGEDSRISEYFSQITNSVYSTVYYHPNDSGIQVTRQDGVNLTANCLSGGAYDQLYFAIRLALGEKLLKGQRGFLILDDPFLKSDTSRLIRQIGILLELSKQGWQILYYSAKDEVLQALRDEIESKEIALKQVPKSVFELNY
jgi:uncharacterized protein YhaN